ncbi:MAG: hypothetical protein HOO06_08860 [Bdellovibrionaceae bacterium]|jgi:hypothetical protein|nr:hypothetical protein [Pseudobdellovibrionaceae bacterium]
MKSIYLILIIFLFSHASAGANYTPSYKSKIKTNEGADRIVEPRAQANGSEYLLYGEKDYLCRFFGYARALDQYHSTQVVSSSLAVQIDLTGTPAKPIFTEFYNNELVCHNDPLLSNFIHFQTRNNSDGSITILKPEFRVHERSYKLSWHSNLLCKLVNRGHVISESYIDKIDNWHDAVGIYGEEHLANHYDFKLKHDQNDRYLDEVSCAQNRWHKPILKYKILKDHGNDMVEFTDIMGSWGGNIYNVYLTSSAFCYQLGYKSEIKGSIEHKKETISYLLSYSSGKQAWSLYDTAYQPSPLTYLHKVGCYK